MDTNNRYLVIGNKQYSQSHDLLEAVVGWITNCRFEIDKEDVVKIFCFTGDTRGIRVQPNGSVNYLSGTTLYEYTGSAGSVVENAAIELKSHEKQLADTVDRLYDDILCREHNSLN